MSATMMNHSRRQILMSGPSNNKRKEREREGLEGGLKPSAITTKSLAKPSIHRATPNQAASKSTQPAHNNHLLAGYLANEFLTKGSIFGEPYDPARAEAVPLSGRGVKPSSSSVTDNKRKAEPSCEDVKQTEKQRRYSEVAELLKANDGAYLPGIVNPTQLARFLQLE